MRKLFVVDTSVLLYDKKSIHSFPGNDIVLPMKVLDELDRKKESQGILGENARYVNRFLDQLRGVGPLNKGVKIKQNDQTVTVFIPPKLVFQEGLDVSQGDNQIIATALSLKEITKKEVFIVTKDINMRVKSDACGLHAVDYYKDHIEVSKSRLDDEISQHEIDDSDIDLLYSGESIDPAKYESIIATEIHENSYSVLKSSSNPSKSCLSIVKGGKIQKLGDRKVSFTMKLEPRNKEQNFAIDSLLDPMVPLCCLTGLAGSGKTFLSLMAGLEGVHKKQFERIIITRSIQPVGRDLGFLPGDLDEKMQPWLAPIIDNFRVAFKETGYFEQMVQKGQIEVAPLAYIRGRTFNDSYIIVDEAQNTTIHELKTIITRIGKGSKIVLLGDTDQIDTPYIDKNSNGLTVVVEKLRSSRLTSHVHLQKGERSELATEASEKL